MSILPVFTRFVFVFVLEVKNAKCPKSERHPVTILPPKLGYALPQTPFDQVGLYKLHLHFSSILQNISLAANFNSLVVLQTYKARS
jgi:hypothetical protein